MFDDLPPIPADFDFPAIPPADPWACCPDCGAELYPGDDGPVCVACPIPFVLAD